MHVRAWVSHHRMTTGVLNILVAAAAPIDACGRPHPACRGDCKVWVFRFIMQQVQVVLRCAGADDEEDDDSVAEVDAMMDFGSGPISGPLA